MAKHGNESYSMCKVDITDEEDIVSFFDLSNYFNKGDNIGVLDLCRKCLYENDIDDFTDKMIIVDYLLRNTDRHLQNVAVVRDSRSGQFKRMFPVFDFGNSLWFNVPTENIDNSFVVNKLTGRRFEDDLWKIGRVNIRSDKLLQVAGIVECNLAQMGYDESRIRKIVTAVEERVRVVCDCFDLGFDDEFKETDYGETYGG